MPAFAVNEEKNEWLKQKMSELQILEQDIEEKFVRSSGPGGQKVNKTSSCVYLRHKPTGVEVKCMKDRSQSINRFLARRELVSRIAQLRGLMPETEKKIVRLKKQKAKRRKKASLKYAGTAAGHEAQNSSQSVSRLFL